MTLHVRGRAARAVTALRTPDASLSRAPNTIRQSIADVIEELLAANTAEVERRRVAFRDGAEAMRAVAVKIAGDSMQAWFIGRMQETPVPTESPAAKGRGDGG